VGSRRLTLAAPNPPASDAHVAPRIERVTWTTALTSWPALSSDARLVAYVSDAGQDGTTPQIWVQQIGGAALRLTNDEREYSHLSFSADDTRIIFSANDESGPSICEVPALGGEPRILQRGASRGSVSPDGLWLAWVPHDSTGIRIGARGGAKIRAAAAELVDVACGLVT
jgi:Tol biopolymer transport system component